MNDLPVTIRAPWRAVIRDFAEYLRNGSLLFGAALVGKMLGFQAIDAATWILLMGIVVPLSASVTASYFSEK